MLGETARLAGEMLLAYASHGGGGVMERIGSSLHHRHRAYMMPMMPFYKRINGLEAALLVVPREPQNARNMLNCFIFNPQFPLFYLLLFIISTCMVA